MNYYGGLSSGTVNAKLVYEFLKKAMRLVKEDRPFRGPEVFQEGDWLYIDKSSGTVEKFEGVETIFFKKKKAHEIKYHGGIIAN